MKRNEFEPEYDNAAEVIIAEMEFVDGEPEGTGSCFYHRMRHRFVRILRLTMDARPLQRSGSKS